MTVREPHIQDRLHKAAASIAAIVADRATTLSAKLRGLKEEILRTVPRGCGWRAWPRFARVLHCVQLRPVVRLATLQTWRFLHSAARRDGARGVGF